VVDGVRCYAFTPQLRLSISGANDVLDHFDAEYDAVAVPDSADTDVRVAFGDAPELSAADGVARGGHKTVRWCVALPSPDARPLVTSIRLSGLPRSFGLSLVQGYFVEPLLSVAAARANLVLLPSAAVAEDGKALLIVGRSRTGKSSLSVRAAAAGRRVLGDDQIIVDGSGTCRSFPRRLRFYSDLRDTAPDAYRSLPSSVRTALALRQALRTVTRGFASPPVRVPLSLFGAAPPRAALPLARIAVVRRSADVSDLVPTVMETEQAVREAIDILAEQRLRLEEAGRPCWSDALVETLERERAILSSAFAGIPILDVSVPNEWIAPRAIAALADLLETERVNGPVGR